eukprot:gnl/TRDRNA2_/TRDRNA2_151725_c1_seq2.p1 gnl/TRDRNA2_/TRDRNA2_151725_c1~~gnl/TRDRNA2_/TRDRNA2_151725_c1_seq2.p1  ORF type:complete len:117 (-),score=12.36 gnl/TRDRNA2_/TRDRNA2_151725_c1_seq2:102-452(-)
MRETQGLEPMTIVDRLTSDGVEVTDKQEDIIVGLNMEVRKLPALALAVMLLRKRPDAALAMLSSTSAAERLALVEQWLAYGEGESLQANLQSVVLYSLPLLPLFLVVAYFLKNYVV